MAFEVNEDVRRAASPPSSVAKLGSVSLLGESAVDITPVGTGDADSGVGLRPPGRPAAQLSDITDQAGEGIEELTSLIHDVRPGAERSAS